MSMSIEKLAEENARRFLEARLAALIIVGTAIGSNKVPPNDPKVELCLRFLQSINGVEIPGSAPAASQVPAAPRSMNPRVNTVLGGGA